MEAQRAADCVGERIESTKRWRVQEVVHTPGSFSSLAAELLQCYAQGLNLKGINRRKYYLRGISIKHGRGCKHGRPPTVGRYMCPTRKVRKGLACGWERDPHIRPDYTGLEGPHQAAVVLTVIGEGLPTSKLLQMDRTFERHSASTGRGSGVGITKIRHSCNWNMNFQPMQWPIAWDRPNHCATCSVARSSRVSCI